MDGYVIRPFSSWDEDQASRLLDQELGGRHQARLGEMHDVLALPGFVASLDDEVVGVATYAVERDRAELAVIAVSERHRGRGVGGALVDDVLAASTARGAKEVWLVTTNDNTDALRMYQRKGFRLAALNLGAVERARDLKPSIPLIGRHGIPIRDELVLVHPLA